MINFKGIYKGNDLSNSDYHAEKEHLSSSNLKVLLKDTAKFYEEKVLGNKVNETKSCFDEGSFVHALILEPHLVNEEFVMFEGFRKAGNEWDNFLSLERAGKNRTILSKPAWMRCIRLVEGYRNHPIASDMVKNSEKEFSLFLDFLDVPIKVRADAIDIHNGIIIDVKTTSHAIDKDSFTYTVKDFDYGLSAALYTKMFEEYYGKPFSFYWVVLGKKDFSCEVYKMSEATREAGNTKILNAISVYKECKKSGNWTKKSLDTLKKIVYNGIYEIVEI